MNAGQQSSSAKRRISMGILLIVGFSLGIRFLWSPGIWIASAILTILGYFVTLALVLKHYIRGEGVSRRRAALGALVFSVLPAALLWSMLMTPRVTVISLPAEESILVSFDDHFVIVKAADIGELDRVAYALRPPLQYSLGTQGISVDTSMFGRGRVALNSLTLTYTKGVGIRFGDTLVRSRDMKRTVPLSSRMIVLRKIGGHWELQKESER